MPKQTAENFKKSFDFKGTNAIAANGMIRNWNFIRPAKTLKITAAIKDK